MSKFSTTIPVDVAAVIAALPPKSFVHSIELKQTGERHPTTGVVTKSYGVEVVWDNDAIKTPYTFAMDCPIEKLLGEKPVDKPAKKGKK